MALRTDEIAGGACQLRAGRSTGGTSGIDQHRDAFCCSSFGAWLAFGSLKTLAAIAGRSAAPVSLHS
ncbi:hypothetical protein OG417_07015 [Actinoallomurus sp. NBC_01490]|uniref:hypothetical protein n=1 Tax=Actinoallomurus sp. NBC_01490 TaxID=2903557 RepID=UPI002E37E0B8|nr:hypothetical protein [Actinoallomurus sp. NBC_01490]